MKANIPAHAKIITGNALEVIPTLEGTFDFVFLDAEKTEYLQYLKHAEPKLHKAQWFANNAMFSADQMSDYLRYVRCAQL